MPVPLGKVNGSKAIQRLTAALAAKQRELDEVQQQHDVLCYQHQLLVALCDSLNWLRNRSYERTHGDASVLAAAAGELASTEEMGLLQQLQGATYSLRFARLPTQAEMQQPWQGSMPGDTQPIAPPDDMLHLFHKLVLLPPLQDTGSLELKALQADYMAMLRELSLNLYLHKAGRTASGINFGSPSPLERIAAVLTRHLHLLSSVSLAQRGDLVSRFLLSNCETGEIMPAVNQEQHRSVVPHLNLTQQQMQNMSAGIPVFKRLLQPVVTELRQLQQEELRGGTASSTNAVNACGSSAACGSGSGSGSSAKASAAAATLGMQAACLQVGPVAAADPDVAESFMHFKELGLQQRRARRLEILLQKEYLIRSYASTYVYGCLSWVQLATLSVLMTPFSPAPAVLVQEIFTAMEQQQQQQQQQQDQAAQHTHELAQQQQQQQQVLPAEKRPRSRNRRKQTAAQQRQQLQDRLHASGSLHSSDEQLQLLQQQQDAAQDPATAQGSPSDSVDSMEQ